MKYKTSLLENDQFKTLSFLRRGNSGVILNVKKSTLGLQQYQYKKKKDLLDLLPLIPPIFHQFYHELKTTNETQDNDPDLDEDTIDGEQRK